MTTKKKLSNYQYFLKADTSGYEGQWIAIADAKIVDHGRKADTVYYRVKKKYPGSDISLAKIPREGDLIYDLF
ncbi:hypothetical protein A2631_05505 [Candidatus Daviesbacteria bacterium RIFCSPHIGHO2_01_FULL_44_29]|uniref:DUF5678 domain-containing protein n=1 Tax=Candidatus Daviesbacteria bacterium RIFCSPHIGHO2_02_FULL_43_12 TaxID=1797776 RepID=A0A1F5KID1_9BACT|nr:MAG: hypothetical protein A2631_05505 [Candidatus Daviesbacteria bacterium RIFCSPHIGHO2_01_FULL_44_29]OGE39204.1 MAG: hypothetical protein A3E86_01250 [Candidatus Daviesbacteria bacterium RIFCSPHIGHO2_12_FULL_47_45]OGE40594.1 MAG: hypothetical protein A3D25_00560 [Candidatus Daviesbacteria bacterium RIFCSPHIGHO2_02_FULL_43_12]OGE70154.1 MAG: hypothetical protein A3B55_00330 [Candidatus Daviesbacteria bacterium RIFCSPLOWO2_01_FULL_43_15]